MSLSYLSLFFGPKSKARWGIPRGAPRFVKEVRHDTDMTVEERHWTLLTNHGRLLLLIARHPDARLRELANEAGVTERTAQGIVADLERAGYIKKEKVGRRNAYAVNRSQPFRHSAESGHSIGELLDLFGEAPR